jgi:hypothetical protein
MAMRHTNFTKIDFCLYAEYLNGKRYINDCNEVIRVLTHYGTGAGDEYFSFFEDKFIEWFSKRITKCSFE